MSAENGTNHTIQIPLVTREESIRNIIGLIRGTTPGEWGFGTIEAATHEDAVEWFRKNLAFNPDRQDVFAVGINDHDDPTKGQTVLLTGNGPNSEANARFIANCREALQYLMQELNTETIARAVLSKFLLEAIGNEHDGDYEFGLAHMRNYVLSNLPQRYPAHLQPTREGARAILAYLGELEEGTDAQGN